jgi:hypothetical protein
MPPTNPVLIYVMNPDTNQPTPVSLAGLAVQPISWECLGDERISADGVQVATLPTGTTIVVITAETAPVRYQINGAGAATSVPVPVDQSRVIGPLSNLTSLGIFNAASSVVYLEYFREES